MSFDSKEKYISEAIITDVENSALYWKLNVGSGGCFELIKIVLECCFTMTWFYFINLNFTQDISPSTGSPFSSPAIIVVSFFPFH